MNHGQAQRAAPHSDRRSAAMAHFSDNTIYHQQLPPHMATAPLEWSSYYGPMHPPMGNQTIQHRYYPPIMNAHHHHIRQTPPPLPMPTPSSNHLPLPGNSPIYRPLRENLGHSTPEREALVKSMPSHIQPPAPSLPSAPVPRRTKFSPVVSWFQHTKYSAYLLL